MKQTITYAGVTNPNDAPRISYSQFQFWIMGLDDQYSHKSPPQKGNCTRTQNAATRYRWYLSRIRHFDRNKVPRHPNGSLHNLYGHDHYDLQQAIDEVIQYLEQYNRDFLSNNYDVTASIQLFFEWFAHPTFAEVYDFADKKLTTFECKEN